jgi:hypothetical protein
MDARERADVPAIHVFFDEMKQDVDARQISAFTRVFDALWPGMTSQTMRALASVAGRRRCPSRKGSC